MLESDRKVKQRSYSVDKTSKSFTSFRVSIRLMTETTPGRELNERGRQELYVKAGQIFQPATPIKTRDFFAGRLVQIGRVADAVSQAGLHVAIYGERGVGKTSLANILSELGIGPATIRVNCDAKDTFESVWSKLAERLVPSKAGFGALEANLLHRSLKTVTSPDDVVRGFMAYARPVVAIFDEFDKMPRDEARGFSDLIKSLSDHAVSATIILVGVAETVTDLVQDHASVERALKQVEMPRMEDGELGEILDKAAVQLGVTFSANARATIVSMSQGLPHYTHLLGRDAVRAAVRQGHLCTGVQDVRDGIENAINDAEETIRDLYEKAVSSAQTDALYRQVLLSCALTKKGPRSSFRAADVARSMTKLMKVSYKVPAISKHLKSFSEDEARGRILIRRGGERNYTYRFANPLVESYVLMRGVADKLIEPMSIGTFAG
jgi:Cdc6-like AAA superfamily ATPase